MYLDEQQWQRLNLPFDRDYHDALQQQHHAAQFVALVGRYLIPQQPDDSNTNMQYLFDKRMLAGNEIQNGIKLALQLPELELHLLDRKNASMAAINLVGRSREQVFGLLQESLRQAGLNSGALQKEVHFEIPDHPVARGVPFSQGDKKYFVENARYRHNADLVLRAVTEPLGLADSVRVWPHHFDTGAIIPLASDQQGEVTKSLGLGWAIPDTMIAQPYFYLSAWEKDPVADLSGLPGLSAGDWMMPQWNGAVLRHDEILQANSATEQFNRVRAFFGSGINILKERMD